MNEGPAGAYRRARRILGFPVGVRSDSRPLIDLFDDAFAAWPRTRATPIIRLRLDVRHARRAPGAPRTYDWTDARMVIAGDGVHVDARADRGRARGLIAEARLEDPDDLRYGVVEAATLFMLTARGRVPFHAAALVRGGVAVLLTGPSGAGKSTSAYAAVRAGWALLSDDTVFLEAGARPRVWGWPGFLHVGVNAAAFFPELRDREPRVQANGKPKIAIAARRSRRPWTSSAVLCLLRRGSGDPAVQPVALDEALDEVTARLEPGFDRFADALPQVLGPGIAPIAWRLDPGDDPGRVPALLDRIAAAVSRAR